MDLYGELMGYKGQNQHGRKFRGWAGSAESFVPAALRRSKASNHTTGSNTNTSTSITHTNQVNTSNPPQTFSTQQGQTSLQHTTNVSASFIQSANTMIQSNASSQGSSNMDSFSKGANTKSTTIAKHHPNDSRTETTIQQHHASQSISTQSPLDGLRYIDADNERSNNVHGMTQIRPDMSLHSFPTELMEEYDPAEPNDFERYERERILRKEHLRAERRLERQLAAQERERERMRKTREAAELVQANLNDQTSVRDKDTLIQSSSMYAQPQYPPQQYIDANTSSSHTDDSNQSGRSCIGRGRGRGVSVLPAWMTAETKPGGLSNSQDTTTRTTRASQSDMDTNDTRTTRTISQSNSDILSDTTKESSKPRGMALAAKMMANWGYTEGRGLGRTEHGIAQPLEHQKIGSVHGRILAPTDQQYSSNSLNRNMHGDAAIISSRILLFEIATPIKEEQNDTDTWTERVESIRHKCMQFGPVLEAFSIDSTIASTPVKRIFIEFENDDCAQEAYRAIYGQTLFGRTTGIFMYPETKYDEGELDS